MTKTFKVVHHLLPLLKDKGLTRPEIRQKLGINNRSVTRYLKELETFGYKIIRMGQKRIRYRIQSNEAPIIHESDIEFLREMRRRLERTGNLPDSDTLKGLIKRLSNIKDENESDALTETISGNDLFLFYPAPNGDKSINPSTIKALYLAAKHHSEIKVDYMVPQTKKADTFYFHPIGLSMRGGKLYCCGMRPDNRWIYSLPIVRFKRIATTGKRFEPLKTSMADIYSHSFGSFLHDKPEKVVIQIKSPWMLSYLKEAFIHPTAKIIKKKGKTYLTMEVGVDEELLGWVMSWGGKMKMIK
jgi:hypothetical protein